MVAKAAELFQRQGYAATGLKQIVEESGTPKGSLYFHFPGGKEELATAAIAYACGSRLAAMEQIFAATDTAVDAFTMLLATMRTQLVASGFKEGCPIATVVLETAASSDALQGTCSRAWERWTDLFEGRLTREGFGRERARHLATVTLAMMEGSLMLARAHRSAAPLDAALAEVRRMLTSGLEPPQS